MRVQVHGAIWVDDQLVVHRSVRRGRERLTLPGGRVKSRESVTDALEREVREEIGVDIDVGDLLLAAEVVSAVSRQDVVLVFEAKLRGAVAPEQLELVEPDGPRAEVVLPGVVGELARQRYGATPAVAPHWLGNLFASSRTSS